MDHFDGADHLAMRGGFREADVLEVTRAAFRDGLLEVTTAECGVLVRVPVHPGSAAALAAAPRHDAATIAANQSGQPWTVSGDDSTFGKAIDRLEKASVVEPGLTMHGLRHAPARGRRRPRRHPPHPGSEDPVHGAARFGDGRHVGARP